MQPYSYVYICKQTYIPRNTFYMGIGSTFYALFDPIFHIWGEGWRSSKWLDKLIEEHRIIKKVSSTLLLSAASSYMLSEKEPFDQVLPLYMEFRCEFFTHHERNEEFLAMLAGLLDLFPKRYTLIRSLEDIHLTIEYRFKDLVKTLTYISESWGRDLASRAAMYHKAIESHIESIERDILPKILYTLLKVEANEEKISHALKKIECKRVDCIVKNIENRLSNTVLKNGAAAMNIIDLRPYKRHIAITKKIREIKNNRIYKLILAYDCDLTSYYRKLLNTEPCFDQKLSRIEQLSDNIWVSMISLREGCR